MPHPNSQEEGIPCSIFSEWVRQKVNFCSFSLRGGTDIRAGDRKAAAIQSIHIFSDGDVGDERIDQILAVQTDKFSSSNQFIGEPIYFGHILLSQIPGDSARRGGMTPLHSGGDILIQKFMNVDIAETHSKVCGDSLVAA